MKSADIKVGDFYAVKHYDDPQGIRAEAVAVGVSRYHDGGPGRLVEFRREGSEWPLKVGAASVLGEWTGADDERVQARADAKAQRMADRARLADLVNDLHLPGVTLAYCGLAFRDDKAAIALLESVKSSGAAGTARSMTQGVKP